MHLICSLFLLIILPSSVWMQNGGTKSSAAPLSAALDFQKFTNEDGLAQNTIFSVLQDRRGFVWSGSWHGLSRFDGYQFVNYTHDFQNPHSVSDNQINTIYETPTGEIWVGTRNGLNRYDYETDDFDSYKFDGENTVDSGDSWVTAVFEDSRGTLWIGTRKFGLGKFDKAAGKFAFLSNDPNNSKSLSSNIVAAIGEDQNGSLWVATWDALHEFDRDKECFTRFYPNGKTPNDTDSERINAMLIDSRGIVWLGARNGLSKFDSQTKQFKFYVADDNNPKSLSHDSIRSIYETEAGAFWVGTKNGLNRYFAETDDFARYKYDPSNPRSLGEGEILAIVEGSQEQLWVGTSVGGLNKYNQKKALFSQFKHEADNPNSISQDNVFSIVEDKNNDLWISLINPGLIRYSRVQSRFEFFDAVEEWASAVYADRAGKIWIGTPKEFFYFEPSGNRLTAYKNPENGAAIKNVTAVREDRHGNLWFGASAELFKIERASGILKRIRYRSDTAAFSYNQIQTLFEDSRGDIWIGTRNSLTQLNPADETFSEYRHEPGNPNSLSADDIGAIYEDKRGTLWVGTESGGLNRFNQSAGTFSPFTEREGLPSNKISEILEDDQNNLWLGTDRGLARFNPETEKFRNFDRNDGLPSNEFNDRAALKTGSGEMYFGTTNGLVSFNPKDISESQILPPVYITAVRVLERPLKLEQNVSEIKELHLSWRDSVVSFDFAALDFTDPKKLHYQWRLEGFDEEWMNGGTRRTATYTNLPGGEYVLKVKATNVDGVWTGETVNLKVIVTPPFYQTIWFFSLGALAAVILVILLHRYRTQQLRTAGRTQTTFTRRLISSQESERKRIAQELHDSTAQNLFALTVNLTKLERTNDSVEGKKELIEESLQLGEQVMNEIRDISYLLHPPLLEQSGLTKTIEWHARGFAKRSGIDVALDLENVARLGGETELALFRIAQECLTNIQKHSQSKTAKISLRQNEKWISLTVSDDGIGIERAKNSVSPIAGSAREDGLGLQGIRQRVEYLNGCLAIKSDVSGTVIEIGVPIVQTNHDKNTDR